MMRSALIIIVVLFISKVAIGQDSLVYFSDLILSSPLEKESFKNYLQTDNKSLLSLFIAADPSQSKQDFESASQKYLTLLSELNNPKIDKKKPEKKVAVVYEKVHDKFFDQYVEQILFSDIFKTGKYNCVTATALYGLYFDALSIPYVVKEKPTHVYLVAYPREKQILVESTDPQGGYLSFSDKNKEVLIDRLANAKLISSEEMQTLNINQLFSKYYLADQNITLTSLVGIHYLNDAIYKIAEEDYRGAYSQAQKAWFFYPSYKTENLLLATCMEYLSHQDYSSSNVVKYIRQLSRFEKLEADFVINQFNRMITSLLIEQNNASLLESNYTDLLNSIEDESLLSELTFLYNYERGRVLYNQAKFSASLDYFQQAYHQKPNHLDVSAVFTNALAQSLTSISNTEAIAMLENYQIEMPEIQGNNYFASMLTNAYLIEFARFFDMGDEKQGLKYKSLFENLYDPALAIDQNNLGRAYSLSAVYYFRKGKTTKAKQIINEGLNKAPHNYELITRKRMIN